MARAVNFETKARLGWRFTNVSENEGVIDLFDVIGEDWWGDGVSAKDFIQELRDLGPVSKITLNINSPGGYVDEGLAMYDAILTHPAEVTAHIISASSAASFVAMGADHREITRNGKVFIHDAQGVGMGDATTMRQLADILDEESNNIASIYAERAGGTTAEWRGRMQAGNYGTTYRGQEAVDIGLVDEVAATPTRDVIPGRIAAQEQPVAEPAVDLPIDLIPPLANGYTPPLPDDFTRLLAANLPRKEG